MDETIKNIRMDAYKYVLPEERIAKHPLAQRDQAKLLVHTRKGKMTSSIFADLGSYLPKKSILVFNNTKVIQARLHFRKESGALIEVMCLEPAEPTDYALNFQQTEHAAWICLIGNLKKWKEGVLKRELTVKGASITLTATRAGERGVGHWIDFRWDNSDLTFSDILEAFGELPIPPYLNRETEESDKDDYQTVYSKVEGSVAAPTAGLHFTPELIDSLRAQGVETAELTLHVGAGTFKPVKSEEIGGHEMHTEYFTVTRDCLMQLDTLFKNEHIVAVGTTSVRALESLYVLGDRAFKWFEYMVAYNSKHELTGIMDPPEDIDMHVGQWDGYDFMDIDGRLDPQNEKRRKSRPRHHHIRVLVEYMKKKNLDVLNVSTQLIIAPGYTYQFVDAIITNFHQPGSTLLLLVAAAMEKEKDWREMYDYALKHDFRFLSYGDATLLLDV
ncbi:MAG: S-adenosylmethionine:tRNA ribosyltransferase-isomerase [Prevotellaceae bacterium]|jgi:S-adenosylmethionine:tRNA ribosyltransferase-isomerase|nr:S-adenosylmethionine:tRNA ribosyltransferase-isomerase [Prevotellaceae bacterium]